jgi:hypothetical protein
MRQQITKKLFYDQYLYRIQLRINKAGIWRGGDINYVLNQIFLYNNPSAHPGMFYNYTNICTPQDIEKHTKLYQTLYELENYKIRVETSIISIYSNNVEDIDKIKKAMGKTVISLSAPKSDQHKKLLSTKNNIVFSKVDYKYKITIGKLNKDSANFSDWAKNNKKIKLPRVDDGKIYRGCNILVKDDKTLTIVKMYLSNSIQRIDEILPLKT